jgi:AcrR family transcriptional regulator
MDKRALRSRKLLQEALLVLLEKKDYTKPSVADICETAGVARPTFYLHYKTKDDLILGYLDDMFEQFYDELPADMLFVSNIGIELAELLFSQWENHRPFVQAVVKAGLDNLIMKRFQQYCTQLFGRFLRTNDFKVTNPELLKYVIDYLAGASMMIIMRWLKEGMRQSVSSIALLYTEMARPSILSLIANTELLSSFDTSVTTDM